MDPYPGRRRCNRLALCGLVARPYEPLADSPAGGGFPARGKPLHGPTKPVLCSRVRRHV